MRNQIVRSYNKSEMPRRRWTADLHRHFVYAVDELGGKESIYMNVFLVQYKFSK